MLKRFRALATRVFTPVARALLAAGVTPDMVTVIGTIGVCVAALVFYPSGQLLVGTLVITAFVFSDTLDGVMARQKGVSGPWGAFLDSTLDRFGDAAIFGGLLIGFAREGRELDMWLAFGCLVAGSLVSYARARAEGLGMTANVGIAERADRLVAILVTTGLVGMGLPQVVLTVVMALLLAASLFTVYQRIAHVRKQAVSR